MPFPNVNYCIVCDSVRQEYGGKLTLLGFVGLAPNVEIALVSFDQPVSITFVIGFGEVRDVNPNYSFVLTIVNPNGSPLIQGPPAQVSAERGKGGVFAQGVVTQLQMAGRHDVLVHVNGNLVYQTKFGVRLARAEELRGIPGIQQR